MRMVGRGKTVRRQERDEKKGREGRGEKILLFKY